jgi:hypothetical protein
MSRRFGGRAGYQDERVILKRLAPLVVIVRNGP